MVQQLRALAAANILLPSSLIFPDESESTFEREERGNVKFKRSSKQKCGINEITDSNTENRWR